jgi:hypothetical protein
VRVLLVSTYELGRQPLQVASPAGALRRAGHDVRCVDLSIEPLDPDHVDWAQALAMSVPMHTAMRMARGALASVHRERPDLPVALYGLYASMVEATASVTSGVDLALAGEFEPGLVDWVAGLQGGRRAGGAVSVQLGRGRFGLPARDLLPPLEAYARLAVDGDTRLAGAVEASHGCNHRCRHCPVPVVYDGRTRLVGEDAVVADVEQLVTLGARHVTFADPDFLSGPQHARRVVAAVHAAFPDISFDMTVKVEHILRHRQLFAGFARAGCLFCVSAFESADDGTLERLRKGHTVADELDAVAVLRAVGIEPRPSLLPFTPWTQPQHLVDLLDLVARADLIGNVDPVHYSIRLLLPPGSLLLDGELAGVLGPYDPDRLGWTWTSPDPRLDDLQAELAQLAETGAAGGASDEELYDTVRVALGRIMGTPGAPGPRPEALAALRSPRRPGDRPRLTESWFCCAEPTATQLAATQLAATQLAAPIAPTLGADAAAVPAAAAVGLATRWR